MDLLSGRPLPEVKNQGSLLYRHFDSVWNYPLRTGHMVSYYEKWWRVVYILLPKPLVCFVACLIGMSKDLSYLASKIGMHAVMGSWFHGLKHGLFHSLLTGSLHYLIILSWHSGGGAGSKTLPSHLAVSNTSGFQSPWPVDRSWEWHSIAGQD